MLIYLPMPYEVWTMKHGYFKMGNISCRIISHTSLFVCKICVHVMSLSYLSRTWASGIWTLLLFHFENEDTDQLDITFAMGSFQPKFQPCGSVLLFSCLWFYTLYFFSFYNFFSFGKVSWCGHATLWLQKWVSSSCSRGSYKKVRYHCFMEIPPV